MPTKSYKIFLVDDDIKTLIMLKHHLENKIKQELTVNVFAYGENCLDRLSEKPDIIVLDYYLSEIREDAQTGVEILKKIKAINPNIEVIMMSSQEDMATALETIRSGACEYIIKNEKSLEQLEKAIQNIIQKKEQQLLATS